MGIQYEYSGLKQSRPPLVIDEDAALWLMRMVYGEGGVSCSMTKASALLWAIINRWFLRPGSGQYKTFVSMLRAFSQSINPRWMTGGDLARKYFKNDAASKARLARREMICGLSWSDIPWVNIRAAVSAFAEGRLPYPVELASSQFPRVSNWASLDSTPTKFPWGVDIQGDWFFEDKELITGDVVVRNGNQS
jgi:hypothetical protein